MITHNLFSRFISGMANQIDGISAAIKPSLATLASGAVAATNLAVWQETIKGWAAFVTVVVSVPTAIAILIYWLFKIRREWIDRNKE